MDLEFFLFFGPQNRDKNGHKIFVHVHTCTSSYLISDAIFGFLMKFPFRKCRPILLIR